MSKYKPGDKFEIEIISESAVEEKCYLTKAGIIPEGMLDMLKKIEREEPEVDWSKVEMDTPVLVKDYPADEWEREYFARYDGGRVYTWPLGATSWSSDYSLEETNPWNFAKLAEVEE